MDTLSRVKVICIKSRHYHAGSSIADAQE